ncbi:short-chain dehydrogenase [Macrolepiota fuliginosa MF-IS2]|uniref:Short-chain dehydrogenase n=1 Tax=Macrolepiota fuliginosa MF-IS2 TaxID=1400762 RepID=A0A9P6C224_9AGAR|nr:short-chain dehydrogenase [Macrolepiota fuliginosa MF-IS2]
MAKKSFFSFAREQWTKVPPVVHVDLKGKTVVVVGANTGLGFEAAQHFARMGAGRLVLACRSQEKGETAIERLKQETGYSEAELWLVDLADFASVRAFVDKALEDLERLDILVLNAAAAIRSDGSFVATKDGWETSIQVNDLSSPLLALLLLPRVLETAKQHGTIPRIVIVSSEVHYWTKLEDKVLDSPNAFEVLGSKEYCTPRIMKVRYFDSKLLNVFFTRALSNRIKDRPAIVNTVNPGLCYSELRRNMTSLASRLFEFVFARTAEQGSRQLIWAAVGTPKGDEGALDNLKGAYISLADIHLPSDFVLGEEGKKREDKLWDDLISTLEKVDPRIRDVVAQHLATP